MTPANSLRVIQSSPGQIAFAGRGCVVGPATARCSLMYFTTGSRSFLRSRDSFVEIWLKYAMIEVHSSSVAGNDGMRIVLKILGRICTTFLKKLNSHSCWILFPSPRRLGGARTMMSSLLKYCCTCGLLVSMT